MGLYCTSCDDGPAHQHENQHMNTMYSSVGGCKLRGVQKHGNQHNTCSKSSHLETFKNISRAVPGCSLLIGQNPAAVGIGGLSRYSNRAPSRSGAKHITSIHSRVVSCLSLSRIPDYPPEPWGGGLGNLQAIHRAGLRPAGSNFLDSIRIGPPRLHLTPFVAAVPPAQLGCVYVCGCVSGVRVFFFFFSLHAFI